MQGFSKRKASYTTLTRFLFFFHRIVEDNKLPAAGIIYRYGEAAGSHISVRVQAVLKFEYRQTFRSTIDELTVQQVLMCNKRAKGLQVCSYGTISPTVSTYLPVLLVALILKLFASHLGATNKLIICRRKNIFPLGLSSTDAICHHYFLFTVFHLILQNTAHVLNGSTLRFLDIDQQVERKYFRKKGP